ncbi:MAG: GRP family sugar transporter [Paludibacter sp.]|jgi:glucose uptake protein
MVIIDNYSVAVAMSFITMLCWGSWANTQKLASKNWKYQLFYWDYGYGVLIIALLFALTMGNSGSAGRSFFVDLQQASNQSIGWAILGGIVFNLSNILLVGAIDIAGLAVAFPLAIGLALIIATITNYVANPLGDPYFLFIGVACVIIALVADVLAYRKIPSSEQKTPAKGFILSILSGITMGFFYRFVAASMSTDFVNMKIGKLSPYSAVVIFSVGLILSNFIFNSILMAKPFTGEPVPFSDYFKKGTPKLHLIGILGGAIWGLGMMFSILSAGSTGYAISYGLGAQGGTLVAALWGVFIWKEFKNAHKGTNILLTVMFSFYIIGLVLVILAR